MITLILGGARSGKSSLAEKIALKRGGKDVVYLATSLVKDEEMAKRVAEHKKQRPVSWQTIEEPYKISEALAKLPEKQVVLIDCITVLVTNILLQDAWAGTEEEDFEPAGDEKDVMEELKKMIQVAEEYNLELIIVTNELGMGLVPFYPLGRIYRDTAGRANQFLASRADEVYITFAGLPLEIKETGQEILSRFDVNI